MLLSILRYLSLLGLQVLWHKYDQMYSQASLNTQEKIYISAQDLTHSNQYHTSQILHQNFQL